MFSAARTPSVARIGDAALHPEAMPPPQGMKGHPLGADGLARWVSLSDPRVGARPCPARPANIGMIADGLAMASPYARPSAHTLEGTPTLHRVRLPVRHHPSSRLPFGHSCPIIGQ